MDVRLIEGGSYEWGNCKYVEYLGIWDVHTGCSACLFKIVLWRLDPVYGILTV